MYKHHTTITARLVPLFTKGRRLKPAFPPAYLRFPFRKRPRPAQPPPDTCPLCCCGLYVSSRYETFRCRRQFFRSNTRRRSACSIHARIAQKHLQPRRPLPLCIKINRCHHSGSFFVPATSYSPGQSPAKYLQRWRA